MDLLGDKKMNGYTYKIEEINGYYSPIVMEKETQIFIFLSSINTVTRPYVFKQDLEDLDIKKGLNRIKKWVKNNHPELLI